MSRRGGFDKRRRGNRLIVTDREGGSLPSRLEGLALDGARRAGRVVVVRGSALDLRAVVIRNGGSRDGGSGLRIEGRLPAIAVSVLDNKLEG